MKLPKEISKPEEILESNPDGDKTDNGGITTHSNADIKTQFETPAIGNKDKERKVLDPIYSTFLNHPESMYFRNLEEYIKKEKDSDMRNLQNDMENLLLNKLTLAKTSDERRAVTAKAENPTDYFASFHAEMKSAFNKEMWRRSKYIKKNEKLTDLCKNWLSKMVAGLQTEMRQKFPSDDGYDFSPEGQGTDQVVVQQKEEKRKLPLYQEALQNILLGFANWNAFETFKKEGKFVKKIFTQFHSRDIEPQIYQNLTRKEKKKLRPDVSYDYSSLVTQKFIPSSRLSSDGSRKFKLTLTTNLHEDFNLNIIYVLNKSPNDVSRGVSSSSDIEIIVERLYLCPEEVYLMRKKYWATPPSERESLLLDNISKSFKIQLSGLLNMIADAEDQSMLYRLADYIEIKKIEN